MFQQYRQEEILGSCEFPAKRESSDIAEHETNAEAKIKAPKNPDSIT